MATACIPSRWVAGRSPTTQDHYSCAVTDHANHRCQNRGIDRLQFFARLRGWFVHVGPEDFAAMLSALSSQDPPVPQNHRARTRTVALAPTAGVAIPPRVRTRPNAEKRHTRWTPA